MLVFTVVTANSYHRKNKQDIITSLKSDILQGVIKLLLYLLNKFKIGLNVNAIEH